MRIPFNKPAIGTLEEEYVLEVLRSRKLAGNGSFTQRCQHWFANHGFQNALLTTSCTDALEMAALLLGVQPGDEVIVPAYTFVSTANAFALRGANIRFIDSLPNQPNMDSDHLEALISERTKAIVSMHYGGVACDMDVILEIANKHGVAVVEDAAQAIDSTYKGKALGTLGRFGTFSFHETKNVTAGEGGCLLINEPNDLQAAEIAWEKGTNRSAFFRGEVDKYNWVSLGSSYLPSELNAAVLLAQLEQLEQLQAQRKACWESYHQGLEVLEQSGCLQRPSIPSYATNNAHLYYLVLEDEEKRNGLMDYLKERGILAVFHYLALHESPFFRDKYQGPSLPHAERFTRCLLRLPLYAGLNQLEINDVIETIHDYFKK